MGHLARRYAADTGGNIGIMASLLAVPLVMAAGIMVDISTISRTQSELQQAMDSAVLAVAREGDEISDSKAVQIANDFLKNNFNPNYTKLKVVRSGTGVTVDAVTRADMAFGALFGYDDWEVAATSSADIAYASYEVALVLDTTGSMAGGKLSAMKDAVFGLVDTMSGQVKDKDKLKFALVPFATFVNVGPEFGPEFKKKGKQKKNTGAKWLDLKGKSPIPQLELQKNVSRFQAFHNVGEKWPGCVETRLVWNGRDYGVSDDPADPSKPETLFVPAFAMDEPDEDEFKNDYVDSDVDPFDNSATGKKKKLGKYGIPSDPSGAPLEVTTVDSTFDFDFGVVDINDGASGYQGYAKGPGFGCSAEPITPLTNDYKLIKNRVNALKAQGNTNIMEGVGWGMRVLSPGEPFTEGQSEEVAGVEKIMIVLTDGSNTMGNTSTSLGSQYSSFGYLVDGRLGIAAGGRAATNTEMNKRTLAACSNAKAAGMTVYTIRLEEPDVKTGSMLADCATSPAHYFDAPSRSDLDEVFDEIKDSIVRLRISS